jgi:hypothetical protein
MRSFFLLLVIVAGLTGGSYAAARFTAGRLTGPNPQGLGPAHGRFEVDGIAALKAKPRGWVIAYPQAHEFGSQGAEIYVSPTGRLLGTRPANLAERLASQRSNDP